MTWLCGTLASPLSHAWHKLPVGIEVIQDEISQVQSSCASHNSMELKHFQAIQFDLIQNIY